MEGRALPGLAGRRPGHRPAHLPGQLGRVAGQRDQRRNREPGGQLDRDDAVAPALRPLGQQQLGVPPPRLGQRLVLGAEVGWRFCYGCGLCCGCGLRCDRGFDEGRGLADRLVVPSSRSGRPVGLVHRGQQRVLRVRGRLGGPGVDLGHPGRANLLQERRRAQAAGAALAPPVTRTPQPERRPGGGHVHQAALLGQVPGRAGAGEVLERGSVEPAQRGQVSRVAAQAERDQPRIVGPPGRDPGPGGEDLGPLPQGQAGYEDGRPLQALGRVHGEQLDRVRLADPAGLQPEFLLLRRGQVGQERAQGRLGALAGERVGHVGEGIQVGAGRDRIGVRPRGDLDVQAEHPLGLGGQVGQRPPDVGAQPPQLGGQGVHAGVADRRVGVRVAEVIERLDQAAGLRGQVGDGLGQRVLLVRVAVRRGRGARPAVALTADQGPGATAEGDQVARPDPPARPGQQPGQRVRRARVVQHPQRGHHVLHLGHHQQPAQAHHLDWDAAGLDGLP